MKKENLKSTKNFDALPEANKFLGFLSPALCLLDAIIKDSKDNNQSIKTKTQEKDAH